jgi:hypothetical protein
MFLWSGRAYTLLYSLQLIMFFLNVITYLCNIGPAVFISLSDQLSDSHRNRFFWCHSMKTTRCFFFADHIPNYLNIYLHIYIYCTFSCYNFKDLIASISVVYDTHLVIWIPLTCKKAKNIKKSEKEMHHVAFKFLTFDGRVKSFYLVILP